MLKVYNVEIAAFSSAVEFLADAAASAVTCLILDVHLDGMSEIELRPQLAACGSSLPVIFMSAIDDDAMRAEALEAGCIAFFRKPFLAQHLVTAINEAVAIA